MALWKEAKAMVSLDRLNRLTKNAKEIDRSLFNEMMTNTLLVAGEHYQSKRQNQSRFVNNIRGSGSGNNKRTIRLTKNHIQKITKTYTNAMITYAPGVTVVPNHGDDTVAVKKAELNNSVWDYLKIKNKIKRKTQQWASDFVIIGECYGKVMWDPDKGDLVGYEQKFDENEKGMYDEDNDPLPDLTKPVMQGDLVIQRVLGFHLLRPEGVTSLDDAEWLCEFDLFDSHVVNEWVKDDPTKKSKLEKSIENDFYVFSPTAKQFSTQKGMVEVYSMYWRPSVKYPKGYYYIFSRNVIFFEGELPYGVFPFAYAGFDEMPTAPRAYSIIKQLRPYQKEINRCASKIAETQITQGDDKIFITGAGKMKPGEMFPGQRVYNIQGGGKVDVLPGRSGDHFMPYLTSNIDEMYSISGVDKEQEMKVSGGGDRAMGQLYKNLRQKKSFVIYSNKFEAFGTDIAEIALKLAKHYYDEERLIPMVGKNEFVNISEFKDTEPFEYSLKVEEQNEDIDTQFGQQMTLNGILNSVGADAGERMKTNIIRAMPMINTKAVLQDLTIDDDIALNLELALNRGETPQLRGSEDGKLIIQKLTLAMRKVDFQLLSPEIQERFSQYLEQYEQMEAAKLQEIKQNGGRLYSSHG